MDDTKKLVRTRFAPSPTGFLHVGGVRTALYNYLFAKQTAGNFILRLEDTDRERFVAEGIEQIVKALDWLGLKPSEGFWISEGQHQNVEYIQSERQKTGLYQKHAQQLLDDGLAYYSYVTPEKYTEYKSAKRQAPFVYKKWYEAEHHDGTVEPNPAQRYPIRLDTDAVKAKFKDLASNGLAWSDEIRGEFVEDLSLMEDFILIKSDGFPTYNFANVVDDHEMAVTHIIRGDEFIASTAKHALLYELFKWDKPRFVHLAVINGTDGKKLSKRTGDTDVLDYQRKGYLPEALINFLALLGWNDGSQQEIFSLSELVEKFSLERINTSPAILDPVRLDWMNGHYIRALGLDELYERSRDFWPGIAKAADDEYKKAILGLLQERLKFLAELPGLVDFFFIDRPVDLKLIDDNKQLSNFSHAQLKALLETATAALEQSNFSLEPLTKTLNDLLEQTGQKPAVLFSLIRICSTWAPASPGLADTLHLLGKEKSMARLKKAIDLLDAQA